MTIAQHQGGSLVTGWGRFFLVCRVLLAALLIGGGPASAPTISHPPAEYSRSQGDGGGPASFGQMERVFGYGRGEIAPAIAAAPTEDNRATFAVARPVYEFATSGLARRVAPHDYEATGPPTTDISQPA